MMARTLIVAFSLALVACVETTEIPGPVTPAHGSEGAIIVANKRGASLSRIDIATGETMQTVPTCENPHELTVSPDEERVLVACYSGRMLEVFRTADLVPIETVELYDNARVHSAIWLHNGKVVAGAEGRGTMIVIDGIDQEVIEKTELTTPEIEQSRGPHLVAVDNSSNIAWGTFIDAGEVVRYDLLGASETLRKRVGNAVEAIALSPDGASLWVASNDDNIAYRLDPATLETKAEVATGATPIRLAMHPSGKWVISGNYASGDLTVIDTSTDTVERTIEVSGSSGSAQVTILFNADGSRLYVAETADDRIAEVDFETGEVLRRFRTGPGGDGLAIVE